MTTFLCMSVSAEKKRTELVATELLPVIMLNYYICLYNNVRERNDNKICLN